jgi:cystathionine gamma-synthase
MDDTAPTLPPDPLPSPLTVDSIAASALGWRDAATGALVPPVHLATSFAYTPGDGAERGGYLYARAGTPALAQLEAVMAALEGGAGAMAFASGMAAATAVLSALPVGARVVVQADVYWPLRRWLLERAPRLGLTVVFIATADLAALREALAVPTALVWIETPSNPGLEIVDVALWAEVSHAAGALLAVDSTCASPALSRPIALGADVVVHGAGKLLNGHGDVMAGMVVAADIGTAFWHEIAALRWSQGPLLAPLEAYLLLRGLKTLPLRVARASATALDLAHRLGAHPMVAALTYPGLPSHPGHVVAQRQMIGGFGVLVTMRLKGGAAACRTVAGRVKLWRSATSFGATDSCVEHRAAVEGGDRRSPDDVLRLAVGLEHVDDLHADLVQALDHAHI